MNPMRRKRDRMRQKQGTRSMVEEAWKRANDAKGTLAHGNLVLRAQTFEQFETTLNELSDKEWEDCIRSVGDGYKRMVG